MKSKCQTSQLRLSEASLQSANLPKCGRASIHRATYLAANHRCMGRLRGDQTKKTPRLPKDAELMLTFFNT